MFPISAQITAIQFPPISEVKGWLAGRKFGPERPLVDLCQAVPSYPPAAELTTYLQQVVAEPETARYAPDEGLPEVRAAVAENLSETYAGVVTPEQVCLTIGASQAFWLAMLCLCQPDDEVIVPLPAYFDHPMGLAAMGIRPVWAAFDEERRGLPDPEEIASLITPRTRAILLVSPSNPTGAVTPPELFEQLLQLARAHDIALVADETYNAFLPGDGPPHRLFQARDWTEHFIHIASFGKTFALTGFRAGALVGHPELIYQALKIQDSMAVCQPRITQLAVAYGCRQLAGWVATQKAALLQRHDRFVAEFDTPKNPFQLVASGGFFAWVRHPWTGLDGRGACRRLADKANLICLPGEAFGPGQSGYLRLAFGNLAESDIIVAVERFHRVVG
jgi:aspartate/methionine/tyrosine aminotransferase